MSDLQSSPIGEEIVAEKLNVVEKPRDWDKAVSVAYLRLIGLTQKKAASGAGIGVRTLRRYELSDWWPDACGEAVGRWMQQLAIECRTTIMAAVKAGDVVTAVKMLERIDKIAEGSSLRNLSSARSHTKGMELRAMSSTPSS